MISVYLFATLNNGFASYPHDHAHELFQDALKKVKSDTQIVLIRKDNLLYYCYIKRIANQQLFGICLCVNNIYVDTEYMFQAFDTIFAKAVTSGTVLKMDEHANIQINVEKFVNESVAINELSRHLQSLLDIDNPDNKITLPPADFSISINDCIELSLEKDKEQIIDAIKRYSNVYIVKTHDEIARITEVANVIQSKNKEIKQLKQSIDKQKQEISDLKKKQKNYKLVIWLVVFICIGGIIFISTINSRNTQIQNLKDDIQEQQQQIETQTQTIEEINSDLSNAKTQITSLNQTIQEQTDNIQSLQIDIDNKNQTISTLNTTNKEQETTIAKLQKDNYNLLKIKKELSDINNQLKNKLPLIIKDIEIANGDYDGNVETDYGKKIYASSTMYLQPRIKYIGFISENKTLKVKWYTPDGSLSTGNSSPEGFSQSETYYIMTESNTLTLRGWGNKNKGHWQKGTYRIEIWYEDICLKAKTFTVY